MSVQVNKLWIVVIALGWIFDFLFWKKAPGINFALFAILCLLGGMYLLFTDGKRPNRNTFLLLPFFLFFSVATFVRMEPMSSFLAYTLTLSVMSIMAMTYLGGRWLKYSLADYASGFLRLTGSIITRPITHSGDFRKVRTEKDLPVPKRNLWPVVRGILLALPILVIFASLLASADVVFNEKLQEFIKAFNIEKLPEYIFRLVYILVIGYALSGVILHAASESKDEILIGREKPLVPRLLGITESTIVLGSVILLFSTFVVIQFQYFFGGQTNIHIEGYTYSEYARKGFGELIVVAFFSLVMLLGLSTLTRRESESQRRLFSGFGIALVVLVLIILVSAYQRLVLYESAYGFSRLRSYSHVFLVWIGLLLSATIVLELLRKERAFALAGVLAVFGFAASLPILNVDKFIVQANIQRELRRTTENPSDIKVVGLDSQYFIDLSDDAIPTMVKMYQSPALSESTKEQIGAALACMRYNRSVNEREFSWQSFHFARFYADISLEEVKPELDPYQIKDVDWPRIVITPQGKELPCYRSSMD